MVSIQRRALKKEAKTILREARPRPVLVTLALFLILAVLQVLSMSLNGDFAVLRTGYEAALAGDFTALYAQPEGAVGFGRVLTFAIELMTMVIMVGFSLYVLQLSRRIPAGVGDIFDAFGLFFRAICVYILPNILVSAWCMLYALPAMYLTISTGAAWPCAALLPLLIPAIRASYAYRQTIFAALDNPQLNCFQCIALSKAAMAGHKWELFKLDLSFLGWMCLCVVPLAALWVVPYINVTMAKYYTAVMDDFAARCGMPKPPAAGESGPEDDE